MSGEMTNKAEETKKVDITKYPEGPEEIVRHMGYLPVNDEERMKVLMAYLANVLAI